MTDIGYITIVYRGDGYTRIARGHRHARRLLGRALRRGYAVVTATVPVDGRIVPDGNGRTATMELRLVPDADQYQSLPRTSQHEGRRSREARL